MRTRSLPRWLEGWPTSPRRRARASRVLASAPPESRSLDGYCSSCTKGEPSIRLARASPITRRRACKSSRPGLPLWMEGDPSRVEYVSRVPRPPLDGLIDDLYYLEGAPPYARLTLPPPSALLIVNLGAPFRIRAGTDIQTAEYADGCVVTTPTRAFEFGYPLRTRSVGVHFKPWGLAPFLPMPAAELCDRPVTIEQVWGRSASAELRDRLATAGRAAPVAEPFYEGGVGRLGG